MDLLHHPLVPTLVLPFVVALVVAAVLMLSGVRDLAPIGIACGLAAAWVALLGWPVAVPRTALQRLPWILAGGTVVALLAAGLADRSGARVLVAALSALVIGAWVFGAPWGRVVEALPAITGAVAVAALAASASPWRGALGLAGAALGLGVVAMLLASASLGQLGLALGAATAGFALAGAWTGPAAANLALALVGGGAWLGVALPLHLAHPASQAMGLLALALAAPGLSGLAPRRVSSLATTLALVLALVTLVGLAVLLAARATVGDPGDPYR
jgi:hypothetical protein